MEQSAATAFTKCVVGKLLEVLDTRYKMLRDLSHESASMQNDLLLLAAFMDDQLRRSSSSPAAERPTAVLRAYTELMRELTHDMEDSIERFLHRVAPRDDHGGAGAPSWPRRAARWVATLRTRLRFAAEIRKLKTRLEDETKRLRNAVEAAAAAGGGGHSSATPALAAAAPLGGHVEPNPVGMEKPIEHLVQLLDEAGAGGGPQQLRVIAIVGFRGSGKTTLARAVYSRSGRQFRERAWVDASRWTDVGDLLADIVRQVCLGEYDVSESHEENLRNRLKNKRYVCSKSREFTLVFTILPKYSCPDTTLTNFHAYLPFGPTCQPHPSRSNIPFFQMEDEADICGLGWQMGMKIWENDVHMKIFMLYIGRMEKNVNSPDGNLVIIRKF